MEEKELLAKNIAYYRKKNKMTQIELANKIQYSNKNISKWELGETTPDVFTVKKLADVFGITIEKLLNEIKPEKKVSHETLEIIEAAYTNKRNIFLFIAAIVVIYATSTLLFLIFFISNIHAFKLWLIYIYNLVFVSIFTFLFIRKKCKRVDPLSLSACFVFLILSLHLTFINIPRSWILYCMIPPLILLSLFYSKLRNMKIYLKKLEESKNKVEVD